MRRALKSEGFAVHPIKTRPPYLRSYGFNPDVVVDVGVGGTGTRWLYRSYPDAQFVLIDPQADCARAIHEKGDLRAFQFHAVALGTETTTATLNIPHTVDGQKADMASVRTRTDKLSVSFVDVQQIDVPVQRLDDVAAAYPGRVGLKVDTEGSEFEVLQGAQETLSRCDFVIIEMSVSPRFQGVGLPSETVAVLAAAGLELRDIISVGSGAGKRAHPRYFDVLFTRWAS